MRRNKPIRVVIDTNVWISFLISNKFESLDEFLFKNKVRILFSAELIQELDESIKKPKLRKYFKEKDALEYMFSLFDTYIDFIDVRSSVNICRDFKDNFLLALAKDGNADFLITGDNDLLVLNIFKKTEIITFSDFIKKIV